MWVENKDGRKSMNKKVLRFLVFLAFLVAIASQFPWNWPI
ncbi:hypothetical protein HMPREF9968_2008 [Streptococcus oralis SK255]|uniref:Uncharacterized protein n=1 Tax=Streptococcus oralis SK255 TaxID=1005704 RepID=F5VUX3_STROR|nr:hypothetical protein HMPREF9968_2008 [Streptococcus oralis SK255]